MQEIVKAIQQVCRDLFNVEVEPVLTRPDEQFGDFATNVALQLSKQLGKNPREIAQAIADNLKESSFTKVEVAGPGFINITLTDGALAWFAEQKPAQTLAGKTVVAEYSDPNPFKVLHAGHIYTTVVGDAIARLLEVAGGEVHRVNYGGDVGLHVGKTMWSIIQELGGENPEKLEHIDNTERSEWLASHYITGTNAYDEDESVKEAITAINKRVYQLFADNDHDSPFAQIYWTCRQWSYEAFDAFYARLGTKLEKYYPESETVELGMQAVKDNMGKVFEESEGAIVFKGEPYCLHTRVFVNREGLPTYEAKEIGLILRKDQDYLFDKSVVVTGNEQQQYMAVVLKAIEQFLPELVKATTYVPHGMVKLGGGVKMSSRKGNIVKATDVLDITAEAIVASERKPEDTTVLGAIKYAFLKVRIGGDIIYDPAESVALEGNSGPYLQYAHARARSILSKKSGATAQLEQLEAGERSLLRKISEFTEVIDRAVDELMPHHITTYLYELAQVFNRFYEHNRVVDDPREQVRLKLVQAYADTLKSGLELINIPAPDRL
jgi:arginyl-tRNA synthetase